MKRQLVILGLFLASTPLDAGLITHTDYAAGATITAAGQNANENAVFNLVNGQLDTTNLSASAGILGTQLANGTVALGNLTTSVQNSINNAAVLNTTQTWTAGQTFISSVTISSTVAQFNYQGLKYRRPNISFVGTSSATIETGLDGTSGDGILLFPDGTIYTINSNTKLVANLSNTANWGSGTQQAGLRPSETLTANTWINFYAVKSTAASDNTNFVIVGSTWQPTFGNYTTLNTFFGTNGWRYLGVAPYGDNSGSTTSVLKFVQSGNMNQLYNVCTANSTAGRGIRYLSSAASQNVNYAYVAGTTVGTQIPAQLTMCYWSVHDGTTAASAHVVNSANTYTLVSSVGETVQGNAWLIWAPCSEGIAWSTNTNNTVDVNLIGYVDNLLNGNNELL